MHTCRHLLLSSSNHGGSEECTLRYEYLTLTATLDITLFSCTAGTFRWLSKSSGKRASRRPQARSACSGWPFGRALGLPLRAGQGTGYVELRPRLIGTRKCRSFAEKYNKLSFIYLRKDSRKTKRVPRIYRGRILLGETCRLNTEVGKGLLNNKGNREY